MKTELADSLQPAWPEKKSELPCLYLADRVADKTSCSRMAPSLLEEGHPEQAWQSKRADRCSSAKRPHLDGEVGASMARTGRAMQLRMQTGTGMTCPNVNGQNLQRERHVQPRQNAKPEQGMEASTVQAYVLRCNSKTTYAPPVSKDAADRVQHPCRCVYGQTLRIKLHIVCEGRL